MNLRHLLPLVSLLSILAAGCNTSNDYIWQEGPGYDRQAICNKVTRQLGYYHVNDPTRPPSDGGSPEVRELMQAYQANGCEK